MDVLFKNLKNHSSRGSFVLIMNVKILVSLSLVLLTTFNFYTASAAATIHNEQKQQQDDEIRTEKSYSENGDQDDEYSSKGSSEEQKIILESVYKGTVADDGITCKYPYDLLSILKQNPSNIVRYKTTIDNGFGVEDEDEDEDVVGDSVVFFMGYDPNTNANANDNGDRVENEYEEEEEEEEKADEAQAVDEVIQHPVFNINILYALNYLGYVVMSYVIVWLILNFFGSKLFLKAQIY